VGNPLDGVCVLELGEALAGPLTCTLLADFGATVVKVERPVLGDSMRRMGPQKDGVGLWWTVTGRGKLSIAVDLKGEGGRSIVWQLATQWADVVVENFRPGVLERHGLGWEDMHAANPRVVLVRISGFGQTGPYSDRRGFGKIAEGFSGATNLTGQREQPPVQPGYALGDASTALFAALGTMFALFARERGADGQMIDLALYEGLLRLVEWQIPLTAHTDIEVARNGNAFPFDDAFITDILGCADGKSVIVSAATSAQLEKLRSFVRAVSPGVSLDGSAEVVAALRVWAGSLAGAKVQDGLAEAGLVVGQVFSARDLLADEHIRARGNIIGLDHPDIGKVLMPGVVPAMSGTPGHVSRAAPRLGSDTVDVLSGILGMAEAEIGALLRSGDAAQYAGVEEASGAG
jgi:crotonobetainyl-CoA:carnitine CoA-transferase CaiB-like acyl-CoA transferase